VEAFEHTCVFMQCGKSKMTIVVVMLFNVFFVHGKMFFTTHVIVIR
jgi:hypothetical protein